MPTKASANFEKWLDGLGAVEADHIFTPVGRQSPAMTRLLNERAAILEQAATGTLAGDTETALGGGDAAVGAALAGQVETAVGESYSDALDDVDARIAAQLEADHPDAPRFRLRGLSDDDYTEVQAEIGKLTDTKGKTWTDQELLVEANLRMVARAVIVPAGVTDQDIRVLRSKINRGEWARLLRHVTDLANRDAEATDLPN